MLSCCQFTNFPYIAIDYNNYSNYITIHQLLPSTRLLCILRHKTPAILLSLTQLPCTCQITQSVLLSLTPRAAMYQQRAVVSVQWTEYSLAWGHQTASWQVSGKTPDSMLTLVCRLTHQRDLIDAGIWPLCRAWKLWGWAECTLKRYKTCYKPETAWSIDRLRTLY